MRDVHDDVEAGEDDEAVSDGVDEYGTGAADGTLAQVSSVPRELRWL